MEELKNEQTKTKNKIRTRELVYTALMAALLCVCAPFTLNIGPIPLSLASLAVYLCAGLLGMTRGTAAVAVYVALGAVGVPVFSGFSGGAAKIVGPTGGYIIGYIPCVFVAALIIYMCKQKIWSYPVGMVAGTAVLYALGTAWYCIQTSTDLLTALKFCVLPFLIGDAIKIAAATLLSIRLRSVLKI